MRRAALVLLVMPMLVAACGGSKHNASATLPTDPAAAVKAAALKTAAAGSEQLSIVGRVVSSGQTVQISGQGGFDTKAHIGSLHATLSAGGLNGVLDEVSKGTSIYVKSDLLSALLPASKPWIKLDLGSLVKAQGLNASALLSGDPSHALTELQSLSNVTKVGTEQIDGAATTHYHATIDVSTLPGTLTKGTGAYDVWVGDDGYVHRVRTVLASAGSKATVTTGFSGFGEKVSVEVPPAAKVTDGSGMTIPGLGG